MAVMEKISFGRWLKRLRSQHDLTQEQLAVRVNCATATLRALEAGARRPSRDMAERLAELLKVPANEYSEFLRLARAPVESTPPEDLEPELPTRSAPGAHLLPADLTPLIGREPEIQTMTRLLRDEGQRLVTIVGLGGVGKTRVAQQVAFNLQTTFRDGAIMVALGSIADIRNVPVAIAEALGVALQQVANARQRLFELLADRELLLLLDNFEHLLTPAAMGDEALRLLSDLLLHAPNVRLLVTSRERLRIQRERTFELQGLPIPSRQQPIESAAAVLLFLERAQQVTGHFALAPDNRQAVARICELLDGMPLAIELAAAWVRLLTCDEIVAEIQRNLDFLALSARDVPVRHHSMRAVFDHSWALLTTEERTTFAQLSVFRGGFRREAAQAVAGATLPMLAALIDKSLLRKSPWGANMRYEMHELVRQYAADQLVLRDQLRQTAARHCDYVVGLLQRNLNILGNNQLRAIDELLPEMDNIRAAWQWAAEERQAALIPAMCRVLLAMCELCGWQREGVALFQGAHRALQRGGAMTPADEIALGMVQSHLGYFLVRMGPLSEALTVLQQSYTTLHPYPETLAHTPTLYMLGVLYFKLGQFADARRWLQENYDLSLAHEEQFFPAVAQIYWAQLAQAEGHVDEAEQRFAENLAGWRRNGNLSGLSTCLCPYGLLKLEQGDLTTGAALIREGVALARQTGHRTALIMANYALGALTLTQGDSSEAQRILAETVDACEELGDPWLLYRALNLAGQAALAESQLDAAEWSFQQIITGAEASALLPQTMAARCGLAEVYGRKGETAAAQRLFDQVLAAPGTEAKVRRRAELLQKLLS